MRKAGKSNKKAPSNEGVVASGTMISEIFGGNQWLVTDEGKRQLQAATQMLSMGKVEAREPDESFTASTRLVIPVVGPLARYDNWISRELGWSTTEGVQRAVMAADADPEVADIILFFDTPGGVVGGLPECSEVIANSQTTIVAYTSGVCTSAGYWLASQCDAIYTSRLGMLGSIGVRSYYYKPEPEDVVSTNAPKKLGSREQTQNIIDQVEAVFLETVALGRGVTVKHVIDNYGAGDVMLGQGAVDAGLADGVAKFDDILAGTIGMPPVQSTISSSDKGETMTTDKKTGGIPTAEHEQAVTAAREAGKTEGAKATTDAVTAERARVSAIIKAGEGKDQALVQDYIADGVSAELAEKWLAKTPATQKGTNLDASMDGTNPDLTNDAPNNDDDASAEQKAIASGWDEARKEAYGE